MAHYGTLNHASISDAAQDIRGSSLYGNDDEKLGKIDDVIFDHSTGLIGYVVVDTGGWMTTKQFIVPASRLRASAKHENDFEVDLNKPQIESFPPYEESDLKSDSKWADYEGRYRSKWETGPVMHREGTDRNITPTTQQLAGNSPSERAADIAHGEAVPPRPRGISAVEARSDVEAAAAPTERIVPAGTDSVVIDVSPMGIGGRWDTFQSLLRERRKQAVASCETCTGETAVKRGSDSVDSLRKAV